MILDQRVIHNTTDISTDVNDFRSGTRTFAYTSGQYLYIGSVLPFNNIYFELGTLNDITSALSVDIWFGNAWVAAVDVIDQTNGLKLSGRIQWNTNRLKGWDFEQDSSTITGLSATAIYDMYWLRMSWSSSLKATTSIKYMGQKFSSDSMLFSFYPDLNSTQVLTSFASGKTTWDEQHYMAAEHIVRDLKKANVIMARSQILDYSILIDASCHKIAEIVYSAFGKPYFEQLGHARGAYKEALNLRFFNLDQNADGSLNPSERSISTSFVTR